MSRFGVISSFIIALLLAGCGRPPSVTAPSGSAKPASSPRIAGMSNFDYLACDGGPHLVLPKELSAQWKGAGSIFGALNPKSDYGRACAAVTTSHMALIPVGKGQAMVLDNPPLSSWGHSPEGWIDIYYLDAWPDMDVDAMLKRAAATSTSTMTNTAKVMTLTQSGLILLYSGDRPGSVAYGEYPIPIEPGSYQILEADYHPKSNEEVYIYRLQPKH